MRLQNVFTTLLLWASTASLSGCWKGDSDSNGEPTVSVAKAESCMKCHNGGSADDYSGPGLENPHPFPGAATLKCTECHGGDASNGSKSGSHIPPPPEIGDNKNLEDDAHAYFNRLTLAGIDKFPDYVVGGQTYSALDYLQFIQPGDLRVVTQGRSCGKCHAQHSEASASSPLATAMGILSSSMYTLGLPNAVPENAGLYRDTASDYSFRAVADANFIHDPTKVGPVPRLMESPVYSVFGAIGADAIFNNPAYDAANLNNDVNADNSVIAGSPLANLFHEQVSFTCGDCHLGSSGANNRYGDFRSSGCTACHMRYSSDGRSHSSDSNIKKKEPRNPDAIEAPERPHVQRHLIKSVAQTLATGETVTGIDDYTCAGCHQGSNRTVLQYWGIRLDQNADLVRRVQYPANPVRFKTTHNDTRLYDPDVGNNTFNGRNPNQYILEEDYDGDGRDDTPADVHYDAGLGCIDCHGTHDVHGGKVGDPAGTPILSRQEQAVGVRCESCHGTIDAYAETQPCTTYDGLDAECAKDAENNPLRNVTKHANGNYYLKSRLDGRIHYVKQTKDVVANSGKLHPTSSSPIYNAMASYAMGRADNDPSNGIGPQQTGSGLVASGFAHGDSMSCVSCHAAWTNNCIGCHLRGEYNTGNNFSNITGERIVYKQANADFTYQTPVPFQLGVSTHNDISVMSPNTLVFYGWEDRQNNNSRVFSFTDRTGFGNNPGSGGQGQFPALSHNVMMPHSIRGKVSSTKEGPRYCVACHLTEEAISNYASEYDAFRNALATNDFASLDFDLLKQHIGQNPGNQLNSPFWVHMVSGLGSGLWLFDENGCPVNPLDNNANRVGCNGSSPAAIYDLSRVALNLDRIVEETGVASSSNNHALLGGITSDKRDGSSNPGFAGPLGARIIRKLSDPVNGVVLDSWIDANGQLQGDAATHVTP